MEEPGRGELSLRSVPCCQVCRSSSAEKSLREVQWNGSGEKKKYFTGKETSSK